MRKLLPALIAAGLFTQIVYGQGDNTRAKPTDWEEVNFEFNQAVMVDGFPSLLRLAQLLKDHPDYKVTIVGNSDQVGSGRANDRLSLRRANAVAQFLQHYGANANQITTRGDGKRNLETNSRNRNARFMNRRVEITVTAPDGTVIGDGSIASAIEDFIKYARGQLGKIDNILSQLQDLENQVKQLQGDSGQIKQDTAAIRQDTGAIHQDTGAIHTDTQELVRRPPPLTSEQTTQIAETAGRNAANYALTQEALRNKKSALVGADFGPEMGGGRTGSYTGDIFGKVLVPFGNGKTPDQSGTHAIQVDGNWDYFHRRSKFDDGLSDGVFDAGVVDRINHFQLGAFAQMDYASIYAYQGGGFLGAGILTADFIFHRGSIGVFGAKGFHESGNVSETSVTGVNFPALAYLKYEDQVGVHAIGALGGRAYLEGSIAFKKRYLPGGAHAPAADLKLVLPASDELAFFIQGDANYTFQNLTSGYRIVFGIQLGNWLRPKDYGSTTGPVPVSVPMPHYELLPR
ncbi:MAG TPA: OmpA family protein [Bryobacteraceae bacterium]|nr:OmpA family protein [Bryobacteraceae bacterium]